MRTKKLVMHRLQKRNITEDVFTDHRLNRRGSRYILQSSFGSLGLMFGKGQGNLFPFTLFCKISNCLSLSQQRELPSEELSSLSMQLTKQPLNGPWVGIQEWDRASSVPSVSVIFSQWDKIPNIHNLNEERFILAHNFSGYSPRWEGCKVKWHGGKTWWRKTAHALLFRKQRERKGSR